MTTVAYVFGKHKPVYALEGSIAVAGSAVKFLRDNLEIIKESSEIGPLAAKVPDTGGVIFVTGVYVLFHQSLSLKDAAFSGLFAPYWIDDARGTICGCSKGAAKM